MKKVHISRKGTLSCLYSESMLDVIKNVGDVTLSRASHVEPGAVLTPEQRSRLLAQGCDIYKIPNLLQKWFADMAPSNGPILGPYNSRDEALETEINWINTNVLEGSKR